MKTNSALLHLFFLLFIKLSTSSKPIKLTELKQIQINKNNNDQKYELKLDVTNLKIILLA